MRLRVVFYDLFVQSFYMFNLLLHFHFLFFVLVVFFSHKIELFVLCLSFILGLMRFGYSEVFFLSSAISLWFCGVSKLS